MSCNESMVKLKNSAVEEAELGDWKTKEYCIKG